MDLLLSNFLSPVVLAFLLGIVARFVRSDLEIPSAIYQALSIYLLFAIGLKGGVALALTPPSQLVGPVLLTLACGVITPAVAYILLTKFGKLDRINGAAAAAHYGSVSAVTFVASLEAVKNLGIPADGYLPALVAILEVPGIIVGLLLARQSKEGGIKSALHEVITGKSIFLMLGGLAIGALCGQEKIDGVAPFFIDPFKGVLCLFLLELGMVAASRFSDLKATGWRVVALGCFIPVLHGCLSAAAAAQVMSVGGAAVFGAMVGSASYIAAPAAIRIALPQASPGIYLTLALGVTFPFNLAIGIPLYIKVAQYFG